MATNFFRRHLVELGVCRSAAVVAAPAEPKLVADFKTWLRKHRGASDATIRLYASDAAGLMTELGSDPAGWRPNDIRGYFLAGASKSGRGTIEKMTTSLRTAPFGPTPIGSLPTCPGICRPSRSTD